MPSKTLSPMGTDRHPYLLAVDDVAQQLGTNLESGLTDSKVQELQRAHPPNELEGGGGISWHRILLKQISNAMILVRFPSL
jgi:Na+-exporting ATPase